MDEEMEECNDVEYTFTAVEIDLDYEYDAVRFFDFTRDESAAEAYQAELWFDTAATYPPSPFVAKLIGGQELLENVNTSPKPKPKPTENTNLLGSNEAEDIEIDQDSYAVDRDDEGKGLNFRGTSGHLQRNYGPKLQNQPQQIPSGLKFYDHITQDTSKAKLKSTVKPYISRTSTLLKPTASQLAKQNNPRLTCSTRSQKLLVDTLDKISNNSIKVEIQPAKRQKLEGGLLNKIGETKQQMNFIHKLPKKDVTAEVNPLPAKLRITIPREPGLETMIRAQRARQNTSKEMEKADTTFRRFKALPLNRKILETPSLLAPKRSVPRVPQFHEFHLKTSERAMQHTTNVTLRTAAGSSSEKELHNCDRTSTAECRDETRCNVVDTSKDQRTQLSHNFKALPLNRKEFNFHTDKRAQHNPPVELFNKLSIASEHKQKFEPATFPVKGSKENRWDPFQQEKQVKQEVKEKPPLNGSRKVSFGVNGRKNDGGLVSATSRSLGVR
ncbi:OLC1v1029448C1 [Oldenlandia corymbosa var. corymbosa]|uniref:OLC1v1029448C1 n=1 Tax=Oldenlandia corymbosa var. corymbosa TaxID=529605 RepID=A0AAV1CFD1_OLDCO|nr:OLC1v1029448C1 [Oldenlandia corymbosa var. corymbosa]